jgi:hypothetical protein
MSAKNRTKSPLLEFTKREVSYKGKKNIYPGSLQTALDSVNKKLTDCCKYIKVETEDLFLSTFMLMLNAMTPKYDKAKLLEVKKYLELQLSNECC